jgi:serpin B
MGTNRRLRRLLPAIGSALGWTAAGCTPGKVDPPPVVCSAPQGASSAAQSLATADTAFALSFYPLAAAVAGMGGNVVFSPYSVSAAMTMVDVGAAGRTESQIEGALHLDANGTAEAPAYAALACETEGDGSSNGNQLLIANSLWAQQGLTFEPAFEAVLANGYGAPLQQVDFASNPSGAAATIDGWVSGKTQGEIPSLLQPQDLDASTTLVLVNAVYFKGTWADGFDASKTGPRPFTLSDGTQVSVPTMAGTIKVRTGGSETFTVAELPYRGSALVMDFLMPSLPGGLSAFEATLTPAVLSGALATIGSSLSEDVYLPKFSFYTHAELIPVLAAMGMTDLFTPKVANLSGVDGKMDLYVSAVVEQALVEVDEQGTVAAGATAVVVSRAVCTNCGGDPLVLSIDQPFVFLIRDTQSGSVLFVGRVTDPRE